MIAEWVLILVVSSTGYNMATTSVPFANESACIAARDDLRAGGKYSPVKLAECYPTDKRTPK